MKLFTLVAFSALVTAEKKEPETLKIGIKHKVDPKDCIAAKANDKLKMHYTGTLFKDGSKFDSSVGICGLIRSRSI